MKAAKLSWFQTVDLSAWLAKATVALDQHRLLTSTLEDAELTIISFDFFLTLSLALASASAGIQDRTNTDKQKPARIL
jgi:hypothetical protein